MNQRITIRLSPALLERIENKVEDSYAYETRAQFVRACIRQMLEESDEFDRAH